MRLPLRSRFRAWLTAVGLVTAAWLAHYLLRIFGDFESTGVLYPMAFLAAWYLPLRWAIAVTVVGGLGDFFSFTTRSTRCSAVPPRFTRASACIS